MNSSNVMTNFLLRIGGVVIFALFIAELYAGSAYILLNYGAFFAGLAVVAAFVARFTLPIAVGAFFYATSVWEWHWFVALLFVAPGLVFIIPGAVAYLVASWKRATNKPTIIRTSITLPASVTVDNHGASMQEAQHSKSPKRKLRRWEYVLIGFFVLFTSLAGISRSLIATNKQTKEHQLSMEERADHLTEELWNEFISKHPDALYQDNDMASLIRKGHTLEEAYWMLKAIAAENKLDWRSNSVIEQLNKKVLSGDTKHRK